MKTPDPLFPGWYTTGQIRKILGKVSRQYVYQIAQKEHWKTKKIADMQDTLYRAEDVITYISEHWSITQRIKLAKKMNILLSKTKLPNELPLTDQFDIECPDSDCKCFAIEYPSVGWACIKGHSDKG
jgi:hypothetical protein